MAQDKALQRQQNEQTFANLLKRYEKQIAAALPEHVTPERMLRVIRTAVSLSPKLMDCSPLSVIASIVQASQFGLDIGMMNEAFIVPRWNNKTGRTEACFQIGYGGAIKLAMQTGQITAMQPRLVLKQDKFKIRYEPDLKFEHEIAGTPQSRRREADIVGAYLATTFTNGHIQIDWMPKEDIDHIRDTYGPKTRDGKLVGPWTEEYSQMALKTAVHNGTKWVPKSTELGMALQKESRIDAGEAPEFVVLDIPAGEADNAGLEAAGEGATKLLKEKLQDAQQKQSRARKPAAAPETAATGEPQGQSQRPPESSETSGEGAEEREEREPASKPPSDLRELDRLPSPESAQEGDWVNVNGRIYQFRRQSWMFYGNAPTPAPKFGDKPAPPKSQNDAGDFA